MREIHQGGYDVMVIDSWSHAWEGAGGVLDLVDKKKGSGNDFTAWKDVTPLHRQMVDTVLGSPCDVFVTMRVKMEYVLETNDKGKQVPRRVGLKPIQREGMEYEFDIVSDIDQTHTLTVSGSRCHGVEGMVVVTPGATLVRPVYDWLTTGEATPANVAGAVAGSAVDPTVRAAFVESIRTHAVRIGWGVGRLDEEVNGKYRRPMAELAPEELEAFANRLARLPDKKPAATVTVDDVPARKITPEQLANAKDLQDALFAALGGDNARGKAKWLAVLANYGVKSAKELTRDQGDLFLQAVRNEIDLAKEGGDPFTDGATPTAGAVNVATPEVASAPT